jgi:hypothetical protein
MDSKCPFGIRDQLHKLTLFETDRHSRTRDWTSLPPVRVMRRCSARTCSEIVGSQHKMAPGQSTTSYSSVPAKVAALVHSCIGSSVVSRPQVAASARSGSRRDCWLRLSGLITSSAPRRTNWTDSQRAFTVIRELVGDYIYFYERNFLATQRLGAQWAIAVTAPSLLGSRSKR